MRTRHLCASKLNRVRANEHLLNLKRAWLCSARCERPHGHQQAGLKINISPRLSAPFSCLVCHPSRVHRGPPGKEPRCGSIATKFADGGLAIERCWLSIVLLLAAVITGFPLASPGSP